MAYTEVLRGVRVRAELTAHSVFDSSFLIGAEQCVPTKAPILVVTQALSFPMDGVVKFDVVDIAQCEYR